MRPEKQLLLEEVKGQIENFGNFIVMKYMGMNAGKTSEFRNTIAELKGDMECVKKRIFVKACEEIGIKVCLKDLPGHISLIFADQDPIMAANKAVYALRKETDRAVEVLCGLIDGKLLSKENMDRLSKLPGKDELRAQLLNLLTTPLAQTAAVMNSLMCGILFCLDEQAKKIKNN